MTNSHKVVKCLKNFRMISLRKRAGLTQKELAVKAGLSQSMIAHIEAGRKEPSKKYKLALAKALNTSVEWLFYEQFNDYKSLEQQTTM